MAKAIRSIRLRQENLKRTISRLIGAKAVHLLASDYPVYDVFAVMDEGNLRAAKRILSGDPEHKVVKLTSFTGQSDDVADPWYTGEFESVFRQIDECCAALANLLE